MKKCSSDAKQKRLLRLNRFLASTVRITVRASLAIALSPANAGAALTEPHAVFYGEVIVNNQPLTALDTSYSVVAKHNGTPLVTYQMGTFTTGLENQYVLRLPMDSVGTRKSRHARTGDIVDFFVVHNGSETLLAQREVGERGSITAMKLGMIDVDGDGVDDAIDNCLLFNSPDQTDSDHDGAGNVCDDFPNNPNESNDSDSDGMGDAFEAAYGFDPFNASDALLDADADGINNLAEFVAGSNPRNVIVVPQFGDKDVPLPAWALILMAIALAKLGIRAQKTKINVN